MIITRLICTTGVALRVIIAENDDEIRNFVFIIKPSKYL